MGAFDNFESQYEAVRNLLNKFTYEIKGFLAAMVGLYQSNYIFDMDTSFLDNLVRNVKPSPITLPFIEDPDTVSLPSITDPEAPEAPEITEDINIAIPTRPQFSEVNIPDMPELTIPNDSPPSPPEAPSVTLPNKPTTTMPTEPELINLNIPDIPTLSLPQAPDITLPNLDEFGLLNPPDLEELSSDVNNILDEVKAKLPEITKEEFSTLKDTLFNRSISPNSPSMPTPVLNEVINVYREKFDKLIEDSQEEVLSLWSSRGFTMPAGIVAKEARDVLDDLNTKRWDMERALLDKVFDSTREDIKYYTSEYTKFLEFALDASFKFADLAIKARQAVAELATRLFSVKADVYRIAIESVRNKVDLYNSILQAERAKLETYLAQIQAERAKGEINQQLVDIYRARLDSVITVWNIYSKEIEAQNTLIGMYRNEIEAYNSLIQAYLLKLKVPEIQAELYRAMISGKTAQLDSIRTRIDAWKSEVDAEVSRNNALLQSIQAKQQVFQGNVEAFVAQIRANEAKLNSAVGLGRIISENYGNQIAKYRASTEALIAQKRTEQEYIRLQIESALEKAKIIERRFEANLQGMLQSDQIKAQLTQAGANISAQVTAAALNSLNAIVQLVETAISTA